MLALEIFGPLLIAGINAASPSPPHVPPSPPPIAPSLPPHLPYASSWQLAVLTKIGIFYGTERAFILLKPLAVRLGTSEGKWEREDTPLCTIIMNIY